MKLPRQIRVKRLVSLQKFLQWLDAVAVLLQRGDALGGSLGAAHRGHDRGVGVDGRGADLNFVDSRRLAGGGVDDELNLVVFQ